MTEVKIFAFYSQFFGRIYCEFLAKDTYSLYSLAYSLMCESSIMQIIHKLLASC